MAAPTYRHYNANPAGANISDCVIRALTVATGESYYDVLTEISDYAADITGRTPGRCMHMIQSGAGVTSETIERFMAARSWKQIYPLDSTYAGFKRATFRPEYLPADCVADMNDHTAAVQDGMLVDTFDAIGRGTRKLNSYFVPSESEETADAYWIRRAEYTARKRGGSVDKYLLSDW